nr:ATP-binding protein [Streptomyces sp. SID13666]
MWVGRIRRIGTAKLRLWGLPSTVVDDAELLISELVTNALQHGTAREISFRFILSADLLLIMVDDRSPGRPLVRDSSPDDESGRGMFLVEAIAAAWGVSPDETRTWCALTTHTTGGPR